MIENIVVGFVVMLAFGYLAVKLVGWNKSARNSKAGCGQCGCGEKTKPS